MPATVLQAELDDFRRAGGGQAGDEVAKLAVGMAADGIEECGGELDLERFGALDEIDQRGRGGRHVFQQLSGGAGKVCVGLDEVIAGLRILTRVGAVRTLRGRIAAA